MNRPTSKSVTQNVLALIVLVTFGVVARVAFQHIPNFAPVAGLALFAGYFFSNRILAIAAPLGVMLISDRLIDGGGYSLPLMLTVYTLLALPVFFSGFVHRNFSVKQKSAKRILGSILGVSGCSLACSLIFFFGTNLMVWTTSTWYEPTFAGLMSCYTNAIPFFRYTLAGDAIFATTLFGSYAAVSMFARDTAKDLQTA